MSRTTPSSSPRRPPLRLGIGGPVGSGKTALTLALCQALRGEIDMARVAAATAEQHRPLRHSSQVGDGPRHDRRDRANENVAVLDVAQFVGKHPFQFS